MERISRRFAFALRENIGPEYDTSAPDVSTNAQIMDCRRPVVIRKAQLAAALRFEFELKIDGKPLGRSERAIAAFGRYLDRRPRAA